MSEADRADQAARIGLSERASAWSGEEASGLARRLDAVVGAIVPPEIREADARIRNQGRLVVGALLLLALIGACMLTIRWSHGVPAVLGYAWALLLTSSGLLVAYRAGARHEVVSNATIGLVYVASVGLVLASAGEAVVAVMVAALLPAIAYGIRGRLAAVRWSGAVLAGFAATALYAQTDPDFVLAAETLAWHDWRSTAMSLMVVFVLLAVFGLDWMIERSMAETDELQEQLQHQAERYRDLVENIGDCMMEYDASFRCLYASPNWKEVMGRSPESLLGRGYLACLHPEDLGDIGQHNDVLLTRPGTTIRYASRVLHVEGHWVEGEVSARTFLDRKGELHMVTIFRDMTALHRAQLALRHSDRLATAGTLAAGIAHQINNPIGAIRNASEYALLTVEEGDLAQIKDVLQSNIDESARCGEIVRSLLQFASREHRNKQVCDLRDVVDRSCGFASGFRGEHRVRVSVELGDVELPAEVSAVEIEQVIVNLVQNAIEARPSSRQVDVVARREGAEAVVEVRDDGGGISEKDLEQVFDPFFTTRLADGGSGLGLSVALGIAREHGGTLEVESEVGKGTIVRLRLPLA